MDRGAQFIVRTLIALLLVGLVFACAAPATTQPASVPPPATAPEHLRLALASSDLAVGSNRVVFGVIDRDAGPVRDASVQVSTFFLTPDGGQEGPVEVVDAVFRAWPVTPRGVFTAQLSFDRPGEWGIGAVVADSDGVERKATARVRVQDTSATPALGTAAPRSISKTLADVGDFERLTTDFEPDADMYAMTIADALDTAKPLMVVFSTPAYCQTATCGPQLDVIKDVKAEHADTMNFIHVEVYDNPHEIEGDLTNAVISPTVEEWGLPSEPWTFIIDGDGVIRAKFEAFTTREELDAALALVIN